MNSAKILIIEDEPALVRGLKDTDRSVDRCVTTLRAKIEADPHNPVFIRTIRDIGYRFETPS